MRILGGNTAQIFRPTRDPHGDRTETLVATVENCYLDVSGGYTRDGEYAETSRLKAVLWCPHGTDIRLRDRVNVKGRRFSVVSEPSWNTTHPATGHRYGMFAVDVEAMQ